MKTKKSEEIARSFAEYDIPWPDGSEDLFAPTRDESGHVMVRHFAHLSDRAEGFQRGADVLVDQCRERAVGGSIEETMVLPILYCYHHALEIRLKLLLYALYSCHRMELEPPRRHDIVELWNLARPLLRKTSGDLTDAVETAVTRCVTQLAEGTSNGEACRYSHGTDKSKLSLTYEFIDLANLKAVVARIISFLDVRYVGYVEMEGQRQEWESEVF